MVGLIAYECEDTDHGFWSILHQAGKENEKICFHWGSEERKYSNVRSHLAPETAIYRGGSKASSISCLQSVVLIYKTQHLLQRKVMFWQSLLI